MRPRTTLQRSGAAKGLACAEPVFIASVVVVSIAIAEPINFKSRRCPRGGRRNGRTLSDPLAALSCAEKSRGPGIARVAAAALVLSLALKLLTGMSERARMNGDTPSPLGGYETLAIRRTLALADAVFEVAIEEKPAGRFTIRNRIRS